MDLLKSKLPKGMHLSPVAQAVFTIIERYTAFPWPILSAQCKRLGIDPARLEASHLPALTPLLAVSVGRFTSPDKEAAVRSELGAVAGPAAPARVAAPVR